MSFTLHGLCETELDMPYHRIPEYIVHDPEVILGGLMWHTAGGRVHFATNSPYIAIKAVMDESQVAGQLFPVGRRTGWENIRCLF